MTADTFSTLYYGAVLVAILIGAICMHDQMFGDDRDSKND